jgi:hypothetical protein
LTNGIKKNKKKLCPIVDEKTQIKQKFSRLKFLTTPIPYISRISESKYIIKRHYEINFSGVEPPLQRQETSHDMRTGRDMSLCRKLHDEELHNLYSSLSIIIMTKIRRMR